MLSFEISSSASRYALGYREASMPEPAKLSATDASALAALIDSKTPNLSPSEVRDIIRETAQSLPDGSSPGWAGAGRVRMRAAVEQKRYILGAAGLGRE